MRAYHQPKSGKWAVTDDEGHLISEHESEASALRVIDRAQTHPGWKSWGTRAAFTSPVTLDVPGGRSWFVSRAQGVGWELEEHRVAPAVLGTETLASKPDDIRRHACATEGELARLRRRLANDGLFDAGVAQ